MKGDFTRNTFDQSKHFVRVLMQQGRVQLDADWNEQVAILLYYLQTLAADLTGPHAGPKGNCGFEIIVRADQLPDEQKRLTELGLWPLKSRDFLIGKGHYYVNGVLCENEDYVLYSWQPDLANELPPEGTHLVYLDVWERHITYIEDDSIREVALNGPDTATRAKVVWQVKAEPVAKNYTCKDKPWGDLVEGWQPKNRGRLKVQAKITEDIDTTDPCITPPEARYRGAENQLYRVEIHTGSQDENGNPATPTFKWSRDNGSVVFTLRSPASFTTSHSETDQGTVTDTMTVTLEHLGRDSRFSLAVGDWVELVDDDYILRGAVEALWQVGAIDRISMQVTLTRNRASTSPTSDVGRDLSKHPLLRRWDHKESDPEQRGLQLHEGAALIVEGAGEDGWLILEDGVQIQFQKPDSGANQYCTDDYWLIPARIDTGDVEWPGLVGDPEAVPPHGVEHHYAPLAIISVSGESVKVTEDCRYQFELTRNRV
jgi:hypothetical protein